MTDEFKDRLDAVLMRDDAPPYVLIIIGDNGETVLDANIENSADATAEETIVHVFKAAKTLVQESERQKIVTKQ